MHWSATFVIAFLYFHLSSCKEPPCLVTVPVTKFADFAKYSPLMVSATAFKEAQNRRFPDRFDVTFRVIRGFPNREDELASRNTSSTVTLGPFGEGPNCAEIQLSSTYILFLRKRTLFGRTLYSMTFNPVPLSSATERFFTGVLTGSISGRSILRSGCRLLRRPRNGQIQCTKDKARCRVACHDGFRLRGAQIKTCDVKSMTWNPTRNFGCTRRDSPNSGLTERQKMLNSRYVNMSSEELLFRLRSRIFPSKNLSRSTPNASSRKATSPKPTNSPLKASSTTTSKTIYLDTTSVSMSSSLLPHNSTTSLPLLPSKTTPLLVLSQSIATSLLLSSQTTTTSLSLPQSTSTSSSPLPHSTVTLLSPFPHNTFTTTTSTDSQSTTTPTENTKRVEFSTKPDHVDKKKPDLVSNLQPKFVKLFNESPDTLSNEPEQASTNVTKKATSSQAMTTSPVPSSPQNMGPIDNPQLGFGALVVGCPIYEGSITIHSVWRDGFHGTAHFPSLVAPLQGGWLVRLIFSVPLHRLDAFTSDIFAVSQSRQEFALVPKDYNRNLFQDLTLGFNGLSSALNGGTVEVLSRGFLLGLCRGEEYDPVTIEHLLPFDDPNGNYSEAWITNRTEFSFNPPPDFNAGIPNSNSGGVQPLPSSTLPGYSISPSSTTPAPSVAPTGRCSVTEPSGSLSDGGNTIPEWNIMNSTASSVDYNELLHKSILFYEAQRSGILLPENRIPWRGDADLKDGCSVQADLTGGWYNSGGNVKSTLLIAFSATLLAWGAIDYREAYVDAGEMPKVLDQIRWATDYLIKCHLGENQLVVQIGNFTIPEESWGPPEDFDPDLRPVYIVNASNPGADVAYDVAAALAAASLLFTANNDSSYADKCLQHALQLHAFADAYPLPYRSPVRDAEWLDPRNGLEDDAAWSATWLYMATRNANFLNQAEDNFLNIEQYENLFYWGDKTRAVAILLAELSQNSAVYRITTTSYMRWLMTAPHYTPGGLLWLDAVGTTMLTANSAFLSVKAGEITSDPLLRHSYLNFARRQLERLVGGLQLGYVVGVGPNSPQRPYHRGSTCSTSSICTSDVLASTDSNPHILYGALVNGPGLDGTYVDRAINFVHNSVGITFNAGFQSLVAGLKQAELHTN